MATAEAREFVSPRWVDTRADRKVPIGPELAGSRLRAVRYPFGMDPVNPAAAAAKVLDLEGKEHPLREFWAERTAVLVFLRHFG